MDPSWHLILDLDGTLVHSDEKSTQFRPYLKEFFDYCFANFAHVSLWSASEPAWVYPIIDQFKDKLSIPDFHFVWAGYKVTYRPISMGRFRNDGHEYLAKKIKKVCKAFPEYTRENTLILDDTPETYRYNYGNAIGINSWTGDPDDREFLLLIQELESWRKMFVETGTVRHIFKHSRPF